MRLGEERWGRGLEDMSEEDALGIIFMLVARMKDPKLITHVAACAGVSIATLIGKPPTFVFDSLSKAVSEWDEEEVKERRALLMGMADQMEAGYAEFKERVYTEGIEPFHEA